MTSSSAVKTAHDPSSAPRTLLLRLKDETRDEHESLERDLDLHDANLTLERYRRIVERFYGFYKPWEQTIEPLITLHLPDFADSRAKASKLYEDLEYLSGKVGKLPLCNALPNCASWPKVLGSLYVSESATLGGQVISWRLGQSLGLSPRRGAAFFSSYGVNVGPMWRSFCAMLQANTPTVQEALVVDAAKQTFASLRRWMCQAK